ncbi:MAG: tRNA pseudouridine(55) synthase TruB [Acidobacteria bacterium]|uniref:tRNA pseudouridine synthase B n=1 Tax=Candidatus Polarisedimenticola svalbardensis TaxID=2886004 RepID=A0A8J7C265_9BACT|nr:tRNA pseudouridine(55) synthase TruB [Candidatus Polarisedimenticola svalbardensis]
MKQLPEGLLLVDKCAGVTSHDVVAQVRRLTGQRKTGHAGTLDPFATGLLPMMLGRGTRLIRFLPSSPKVYQGTLQLGRTTSSDDVTGETLTEHGGRLPDGDGVLQAAGKLTGLIRQVPPAVSARKVDGERMYRRARRGETVEAPATEVEIFEFSLSPTDSPAIWSFTAQVSPGTYIRALARDLGAALECGGVLASLKRTAIGPFRVEDAVPLPEWARPEQVPDLAEHVTSLDHLPLDLPSLQIENQRDAGLFLSGGRLDLGNRAGTGPQFRVTGPDGTLLGVGEDNGGVLQPRVVLPTPDSPACPG